MIIGKREPASAFVYIQQRSPLEKLLQRDVTFIQRFHSTFTEMEFAFDRGQTVKEVKEEEASGLVEQQLL